MAAKIAIFGDWRWQRIIQINDLLPIAQAVSVNQPDAFALCISR